MEEEWELRAGREGRWIVGWRRESTDLAEKGENHHKPEGRWLLSLWKLERGSWAGSTRSLGSQVDMEAPEGPWLLPARGACRGLPHDVSEDVPRDRRAIIPCIGLYSEALWVGSGWCPHSTVQQKGLGKRFGRIALQRP